MEEMFKDMRKFIEHSVNHYKQYYSMSLEINEVLLDEIEFRTLKSLNEFEKNDGEPNGAKIAGILVFWIRKLKPIFILKESKNKHHLINEIAALMTGLAICNIYHIRKLKDKISISDRVFDDWIHSLHIHSHSPNSTAIAFELLTDKGK